MYEKGKVAQRGKVMCPSHTDNYASAGSGVGCTGRNGRGSGGKGEHPDFLLLCYPAHSLSCENEH